MRRVWCAADDLRLHLLGTSPLPQIPPALARFFTGRAKGMPNERDGTVPGRRSQPIEGVAASRKGLGDRPDPTANADEGIAATYHACDVADRDSLAQVLAEIRRTDGPIEGILHGAGFGKDVRFDRKLLENVNQCLRAKVDGAAALMELTREDPLRDFIGFGSISGRFGANGHTDYSAANDMLSKQVGAFRRERLDCAAATFHWHAWGDVGMATKPETQLALEMIGMQFMPAAEGLQHLIGELEAGLPEAEVLITDDQYYRKFYPAESVIDLTTVNVGSAAMRRPLVEQQSEKDQPQLTSRVRLDPTADPFLIEHRLEDQPFLPVVVGLELLCEGASA